jgi:MarR family transcriptional regulator, negative regulator of the multidrug operon emrRAB
MANIRTANLLGALAGAVVHGLEARRKAHPNENSSSLAALNLLASQPGCTNVELSQALKLSHPATVRLVDKLEVAGWVAGRRGADRRSVALHLTAAGRKRVRQIAEERSANLLQVLSPLSAVQRRQLDDIAQTLLRAMTTSGLEAAHICRLCDATACPAHSCPVHQAALVAEAQDQSRTTT